MTSAVHCSERTICRKSNSSGNSITVRTRKVASSGPLCTRATLARHAVEAEDLVVQRHAVIPAIPNVGAIFKREQARIAAPRALIEQRQRAVRLDRDRQAVVRQRALADSQAGHSGMACRLALIARPQRERGVAECGDRQAQRHGHLGHLVALRKGDAVGAEATAVGRLAQSLVRQFGAIRPVDAERGCRLDAAHVEVEERPARRNLQTQVGHAVEWHGQRIEDRHPHLVRRHVTLHAGRQLADRLDGQAVADLLALAKAKAHVLMHLVDATAADRVVGLVLEQPVPGDVEVPLRVGLAEGLGRQGRERLGPVAEQRLAGRVALLDPDAAG